MDSQVPFYLVWSPTGSTPPRYCHGTQDAAEAEADRLARANPGKNFFVVAPLYSVVAGAFETKHFTLPDEVPF